MEGNDLQHIFVGNLGVDVAAADVLALLGGGSDAESTPPHVAWMQTPAPAGAKPCCACVVVRVDRAHAAGLARQVHGKRVRRSAAPSRICVGRTRGPTAQAAAALPPLARRRRGFAQMVRCCVANVPAAFAAGDVVAWLDAMGVRVAEVALLPDGTAAAAAAEVRTATASLVVRCSSLASLLGMRGAVFARTDASGAAAAAALPPLDVCIRQGLTQSTVFHPAALGAVRAESVYDFEEITTLVVEVAADPEKRFDRVVLARALEVYAAASVRSDYDLPGRYLAQVSAVVADDCIAALSGESACAEGTLLAVHRLEQARNGDKRQRSAAASDGSGGGGDSEEFPAKRPRCDGGACREGESGSDGGGGDCSSDDGDLVL